MTGGPWMPSCAATKPNCRAWATQRVAAAAKTISLPARSACGRRPGRQSRNRTDGDHSARAGHDDLSDRAIACGPRCLGLRSTATGSRYLRRRALARPGDGRHSRRTDHRAKRGSGDPDRGQPGVVRRNAVWRRPTPLPHRKRLRSHPGGRRARIWFQAPSADPRSRATLRRLYAHPTLRRPGGNGVHEPGCFPGGWPLSSGYGISDAARRTATHRSATATMRSHGPAAVGQPRATGSDYANVATTSKRSPAGASNRMSMKLAGTQRNSLHQPVRSIGRQRLRGPRRSRQAMSKFASV